MARLRGSFNADTITGYGSNDRISGGYGNDNLTGGAGNDRLNGGRGNDVLDAGNGNDTIISRSDGGEGAIAQAVNATNDPNSEVDAQTMSIYPSQAGLPADDVLTGGSGADTFRFDVLLNAKLAIIEKHTDANTGVIDWAGVTGENNLVHDHWLDGIGNDIVTDFNAADGDRIAIAGHTTEVYRIDIVDADGDGATDDTVLNLRSNQGGAGAHDKDLLGTITVLNNELTANDFTVDAMATGGIVRNISQINEGINPYNPGGGTSPGGTGANAGDGGGADAGTGSTGTDTGAGAGMGGMDMGGATGGTAGGDGGSGTGTGTGSGVGGMDMGGATGGTTGGTGTDTGGTGTGSGAVADGGAAADPLAELLTPPDGATAGLAATQGDDVLIYSATAERGNGGIGDDLMVGLDGSDSLSGGWGNDRIDAGAGDDHVHGGQGDDLVAGLDGNDGLTGDAGDDIVLGGAGDDNIRGGRGDDVVFGGEGVDDLRGGAGNDVVMSGAGADVVNGGAGADALLLDGAITDYTIAVGANDVQFTDANGDTDVVRKVEQFRFLGSGETYEVDNGALALATDTDDLDDLLHDHMLEELIASESAAPAAADAVDATADAGTAATVAAEADAAAAAAVGQDALLAA